MVDEDPRDDAGTGQIPQSGWLSEAWVTGSSNGRVEPGDLLSLITR